MTTTKQQKAPEHPLPPMTPVKSKAIKSIGHDGSAAFVQYANGGIFRFPGVDRKAFDKVLAAESIGQAFQSDIALKINGTRIEG
jgi:hypothetical protein